MSEERKILAGLAAPVVADVGGVLLWLVLAETAVSQLQTPSGSNALYLIGAYIFMCVGVYLLRKLEPAVAAGAWAETNPLLARPTRLVLGALFGAVVMTVLAYQFGYFASIFEVDTLALGEGESATLFVFAPGAWLGMSMVYTAFLALRVTPTVGEENGRYPWQAFIGLFLVNLMLLFMAAQLKAVLALLSTSSVIGPFSLVFFLFLLLFGPPRLIYLSKQKGIGGLTFLVLAAFFAWLVVS